MDKVSPAGPGEVRALVDEQGRFVFEPWPHRTFRVKVLTEGCADRHHELEHLDDAPFATVIQPTLF
ncbi:hypothetical protein FJV41_00910 [Myxococcus llanfairpwllgwyngyllgogerychwyrndrobwllllantysiliogogogochensis]|uniref:Uncharacterized protein n=1 Tax=Myxococcus llanfairpwllgwyngyllgogerychwyrndrobwllllantysiliogogogochensis TaxID=2590453 RepID=A0A540X9J8_9BACT|nr:hypothetical protein FJV41_00910 [Myxococcus llanfairpwllgwyngyllgogerychwyrndrobwllllantysiliogogogochensis]